NSNDGALSSKPGVPGSGGRPTPGGAHSMSVGSSRGWIQLQPAADSWGGEMPAFAVTAIDAAPSAALNAISTVRLPFLMWLFIAFPFHVRASRSPLRRNAQHAAGVVAHPQRSKSDC